MFPTLHCATRIPHQQQNLDIEAGVLHQGAGEVQSQPYCLDGLEWEERTQSVEEVWRPAVGLSELWTTCSAMCPQSCVMREKPLMSFAILQVAI